MSSFAGLFDLEGAPLDGTWTDSLRRSLLLRDPDGDSAQQLSDSAFFHSLLQIRKVQHGSRAILDLDSRYWITGDLRLDDRPALIAKLGDRKLNESASSLELTLAAYRKWGAACVEHLYGEFSFVVWDGEARTVFAARDQLGVFPLYYARCGSCLVVSNRIDAIRAVPGVSRRLNEQAIGDFLIGGMNFDPQTTFFDQIRCLGPAQCLAAGAGGQTVSRYWALPIEEPLYLRKEEDYTEEFNALLDIAVKERLPDGPLAVSMSGGLDSPALAASAKRIGADVSAYVSVYDRIIPDQERHFAGLAARHIGIPVKFIARDDEPFGLDPDVPLAKYPAPCMNPLAIAGRHWLGRQLVGQQRVFFFGDGPDAALLYEWAPYFRHLLKERSWGRCLIDTIAYIRLCNRVPAISAGARWLRRRFQPGSSPQEPPILIPAWINPDFASSLGLTERAREIFQLAPAVHPIRPAAYRCFSPDFPMCGGGNDGVDREFGAEELHPFGDLRMVRFLLRVPVVPWCRDKLLVRKAMRGWLPEAVRLRPKSPLGGSLLWQRVQDARIPVLPAATECEKYVANTYVPAWPPNDLAAASETLRIFGLQYWLASL